MNDVTYRLAVACLQGLLANAALHNHLIRKAAAGLRYEEFDAEAPKLYARLATQHADALLSELNAYEKEGKK